MFYNPLIELIERAIQWARNRGSRVYWGWFVTSVLVGVVYLELLERQGFDETRPYLIIWLFIWFGGTYPVYMYEKQWKKKRENGVESSTDKSK